MLKRIPTRQLELGMYVAEFCAGWFEHPFFRAGFVLDDPDRLRFIKASHVEYVRIDTSRGRDVAEARSALSDRQLEERIARGGPVPGRDSTPIGQELHEAARVYSRSKKAMLAMFQEARMGKSIDTGAARNMVSEISASVMRNSSALISLARLKRADEYTYMHSVAVCALMIALGRQLGMTEHQCRDAGMAGLLHDLGKTAIPPEILNKPGRLTDEEFAIVKRHPADGHRLLMQAEGVSDTTFDVVLHHHEKIDGSGYPEGIAGSSISLVAKMGAVCDVYDAVTSNRPYKAGWSPSESLKRMATWEGHFDVRVLHAFVRSVGIYPIGSFVRLASGKMGVVVEQSSSSLIEPRVKVFYSAKSRSYVMPEVLDLSRPAVSDRILGPEDPGDWGIRDFDAFWLDDEDGGVLQLTR